MLLLSMLACNESCPTPQSRLQGVVWDLFVTPVEYTLDNEEAFPADSSPANGPHEVEIGWFDGTLFNGEITVAIDGQEFEGTGTWSDVECGHFTMAWSGTYLADPAIETSAVHGFAASASMTTYDQVLEGFLDWSETWKAEDGAVGTYTAIAQVTGTKAALAAAAR